MVTGIIGKKVGMTQVFDADGTIHPATVIKAGPCVVKRHHFGGGAATHGSMFHRAPGSIGASSFPSRVVKGMRAAGRMGGKRITTRNLKVLAIDAENNLLVVRGAVPGAPGNYVVIRKAIAAKPEPKPQVEKASKTTV